MTPGRARSASTAERSVVLLGPQRLTPSLGTAVAALGITGRIATVTAGWQEREREDEELHQHLGDRTVNLGLWQRAEAVFALDPELGAAHRARQARLRRLQDFYDLRLAHAMAACRALMDKPGDDPLLEGEREAAVGALRTLDARHLDRIREIHAEYEAQVRPGEREAVVRMREDLRSVLDGVEALAIAGGHVAILLNRLRLFDVLGLSGDVPVFAWSAGSMAVSERIVLFHDFPPQGPGNAEVLDVGLGLAPAIVPLPHPHRRLDLHDRTRIALFARRFAPARCVALEDGATLVRDGARWRAERGILLLDPDGAVHDLAPADAA